MAHEIKIPSVGESITSANLSRWHKPDGSEVEAGEVILTIETDKISTELEAECDGVLHITVSEGEEVEIGAVVGNIEEGAVSQTPAGDEEEKSEPEDSEESGEPAGTDSGQEDEIRATPVARKIAEDRGLDLSGIQGTGAGGKITKADVESAEPAGAEEKSGLRVVESGSPEDEPLPAGSAEASGDGDTPRTTRSRMTPLRRKIASQLVNAQQQAAILTTFNEVDMTAVMALRKQVQESFVARHGVKLGFMSFFVKAVVEALREVPKVNARIDGDEIVQNHFYDIGVAVGTEKGLLVPVIRDCDRKDFAEIEQDIAGYAARAREGKIQLADIQGGGFTISNGGIYGSLLSTPILNPPQSGILGMHTIQQRPVAVDGRVEIRPMMYLALSYDHRIVDGKEAVTFLIRVKECIEAPERMLVGA